MSHIQVCVCDFECVRACVCMCVYVYVAEEGGVVKI